VLLNDFGAGFARVQIFYWYAFQVVFARIERAIKLLYRPRSAKVCYQPVEFLAQDCITAAASIHHQAQALISFLPIDVMPSLCISVGIKTACLPGAYGQTQARGNKHARCHEQT
jgi:hypothetical protein